MPDPYARLRRWPIWLLGALLLAQGLGKLVEPRAYVSALYAFDFTTSAGLAWGVGILWTTLELAAGAGLLATGLGARPSRRGARRASWGALLVALAYALLTTQAFARGLEIANCTCFGGYLPQRLSGFVLAQDALLVAWSAWVLLRVRRLFGAPAPGEGETSAPGTFGSG